MKKMRIIAAILTLCMSLTLLTSCASKPKELPALRFGALGSVDIIPFVVAQEKGLFEKNGVNATIEVFKSPQDRDAAIQAGELDGFISDQIAVAIFLNAGFDVKITGTTDGSFSLVAGKESGIESKADFAGKKVAISQNSIIEWTLDLLLSEVNVEKDVIKEVIPPIPTRLEMLSSGNVDGALLPQPYNFSAINNGAKLIETIESSSGNYVSVTAFTGKAITEKSDSIKAFYQAYNEACTYLNEQTKGDVTVPKEIEDMIFTVVGYPEDMRGKLTLPVFRQNTLPPLEQVDNVFDWSREKNLLTKDVKAADVCVDVNAK